MRNVLRTSEAKVWGFLRKCGSSRANDAKASHFIWNMYSFEAIDVTKLIFWLFILRHEWIVDKKTRF